MTHNDLTHNDLECPTCEQPISGCLCPDGEGRMSFEVLIRRAIQRRDTFLAAAHTETQHIMALQAMQQTADARAVDALAGFA